MDRSLRAHVRKGLSSLSTEILNILRIGAYDLLFMRTPDHAAVFEAVELCKGKHKYAKGLVNAVLRKVAQLTPPSEEEMKLEDLLPNELAEKWCTLLSEEGMKEATTSLLHESLLSLRVNTTQITSENLKKELEEVGAHVQESPFVPNSFLVKNLPALNSLPAFHRGDFYIQNSSSQLPAIILDPKPGETILDACAAPGGKTIQLANLTQNGVKIMALDKNPVSLNKMEENLTRMHTQNVSLLQEDFLNFSVKGDEKFDRILLDAPCSGWGVLQEHPEWRWSKDIEAPDHHAKNQREMIEHGLSLLKPHGFLVYSVCTFSKEETWNVIQGLNRTKIQNLLFPSLHPFVRDEAIYITPNTQNLDGFFVAKIQI